MFNLLLAFSALFKTTIDGGKDVKQDIPTLIKNLAAGLIIFLIPTIINYTFTSLVDTGNDFISCIKNASFEGVLSAEKKEKQEAEDKKKQEEKDAQKISEEMQAQRKEDIDKTAKKKKEQEEKYPRNNGDGPNGNNANSRLKGSAWVDQ